LDFGFYISWVYGKMHVFEDYSVETFLFGFEGMEGYVFSARVSIIAQ
jgi:hypothetical protein